MSSRSMRDAAIAGLVALLALVEAVADDGGPSLAGRAGVLLAAHALGTAAARSPRRVHWPALGALALVVAVAPPETPAMFAGLFFGGFTLGFLVQNQVTRAARLRAQIERLSRTLVADVAALAREERKRIRGHLATVVSPVSAVASRMEDAPVDRATAIAVLEDAGRSAREAVERLHEVLGALRGERAEAAARPAERGRWHRILRVHAVAAPWVAFSVFGTLEQLTLPARPAIVDGLAIGAPAYPPAVVYALCWLTPLPLLARFRAPLVAGALVGALLVLRVAAEDLSSLTWTQNLLGVTIAVIAAFFVRSLAGALTGLAVAAATMVGVWSLEQRAISAAEWLYLAVLLGIAWSIGRRAATELRVGQARRADLAELTARRRRLEAQVATVERARARKQLHDLVGHGLSLVTVRAAVGKLRLERQNGPIAEAVEEVQALIATTERELVELHQRLGGRGAPAEQDLAAVRELAAIAREHGHPVTLVLDDGAVDPATAELVVDVVREALTNVRKHAGPVPTRVEVACADGVEVRVVNEPGAPTLGAGSRAGLAGLRERAAAAGGELSWGPTASGGWAVRLRCGPSEV